MQGECKKASLLVFCRAAAIFMQKVWKWRWFMACSSLPMNSSLFLPRIKRIERICWWILGARQKQQKPLAVDADVSCEPLMLCPSENPQASLDIFSHPHHHPFGSCIHRKAINKDKPLSSGWYPTTDGIPQALRCLEGTTK